jgi:hypothetical protein
MSESPRHSAVSSSLCSLLVTLQSARHSAVCSSLRSLLGTPQSPRHSPVSSSLRSLLVTPQSPRHSPVSSSLPRFLVTPDCSPREVSYLLLDDARAIARMHYASKFKSLYQLPVYKQIFLRVYDGLISSWFCRP